MEYRKVHFLATLVFDESLDYGKQVDTERSFKNEMTKGLQRLVTDNEIKHFILVDDEVINEKLKKDQEPVLDKIRAEFINKYPKNYMGEPELGGVMCAFSLNNVLDVIDKYKVESEGQ